MAKLIDVLLLRAQLLGRFAAPLATPGVSTKSGLKWQLSQHGVVISLDWEQVRSVMPRQSGYFWRPYSSELLCRR